MQSFFFSPYAGCMQQLSVIAAYVLHFFFKIVHGLSHTKDSKHSCNPLLSAVNRNSAYDKMVKRKYKKQKLIPKLMEARVNLICIYKQFVHTPAVLHPLGPAEGVGDARRPSQKQTCRAIQHHTHFFTATGKAREDRGCGVSDRLF